MHPIEPAGPIDGRLLHLGEWIVMAGLKTTAPEALLAGLCERMSAAGMAIGRAQLAFRVLHPLFTAMTITWDDERGVRAEFANEYDAPSPMDYAHSPYATMISTHQERLRARLDASGEADRYPIFAELRQRGYTDYLAMLISFVDRPIEGGINQGAIMSWSTRAPGGFDAATLEALEWLAHPLALALKVDINQQIAWNALRTFHGTSVGSRILGGTIRRGAGERLRTVVWYSDLRNSTALGEQLELDDFLELLNAYFDCTAGAIMAAGGQVLELIGDAVLGIFPVDGQRGDAAACAASLVAARDAHVRLRALRASAPARAQAIAFGTGLHLGNLIFGNVGTDDRLSFGLVGSAVSEAARMEALTKTVARPVLVSDPMAAALDERLEDLGSHSLRGVEAPRRIWAVPLS